MQYGFRKKKGDSSILESEFRHSFAKIEYGVLKKVIIYLFEAVSRQFRRKDFGDSTL